MVKDTEDIAKGVNAVISTVSTTQKGVSGLQKMNKAAELANQRLGTPQLSPSTSGVSWSSDQPNGGSDMSKTSDTSEKSGTLYTDKANDMWYVDALSWSGDKNLLPKPAAPLHFASGELNTYGYNWVYLPYEQTGITYSQGYLDWVGETLASMRSGLGAGVGPLVDEGQNGGGGW
jgi:hypothetical protein